MNKCSECSGEIDIEFQKVSKGFCKVCDKLLSEILFIQIAMSSEEEQEKILDRLLAEAISRNLEVPGVWEKT